MKRRTKPTTAFHDLFEKREADVLFLTAWISGVVRKSIKIKPGDPFYVVTVVKSKRSVRAVNLEKVIEKQLRKEAAK